MTRPVLVGMNNPLSDDRRLALYPAPVNCTGWRLWRLYHEARQRRLGGVVSESQTKREYLDSFDRRNVLSSTTWNDRAAKESGARLLRELSGRRVLILGVKTLKALGLPRLPWLEEARTGANVLGGQDVTYALAPHPSGLCHEYNDPATREAVGRRLLDLAGRL